MSALEPLVEEPLRVREQRVDREDLRAGGVQRPEELRPARAALEHERRLGVGPVVERDDGHVGSGRPGAAEAEARVDGPPLEALEAQIKGSEPLAEQQGGGGQRHERAGDRRMLLEAALRLDGLNPQPPKGR